MFYARIPQRWTKTRQNFVHTTLDKRRELTSNKRARPAHLYKNQGSVTFFFFFFPTTLSSHHAMISCLTSCFRKRSATFLHLIGARGERQWFIILALLECRGALPLHTCMCAHAHGYGEVKVQQVPGRCLERISRAAVRIFDVSDQGRQAFGTTTPANWMHAGINLSVKG